MLYRISKNSMWCVYTLYALFLNYKQLFHDYANSNYILSLWQLTEYGSFFKDIEEI